MKNTILSIVDARHSETEHSLNRAELILVSRVTGEVVTRTTWLEWAEDNGEILDLLALAEIALALREIGHVQVHDFTLINASFPKEAA
jgi:hypothetical protein